jgi:hypothetical protein
MSEQAQRTTAYVLRDAIAEVLWGAYKEYELEAACDRLGCRRSRAPVDS